MQAEELAFVHESPIGPYFNDTTSPLVSRNGVFFSLRLPPIRPADYPQVVEQAASKFRLEQWDRVLLTPQTSEPQALARFLGENFIQILGKETLGLNFSGEPHCQQFIEILETAETLSHIQVPFNLVQFRNFLRRSWQSSGTSQALPKLLENWQCNVSFRSPFSIEYGQATGDLLSDVVKGSRNYQQDLQTALSLMASNENRLNHDLNKWRKEQGIAGDLKEFRFVQLLKEACASIHTVAEWEQYLSTLWFPPFHHHVQSWSLKIPETYQVQWRWMIDSLMVNIHDIMGLQAETLRTQQAQRMQPFHQVLNQYFPEMPITLTFGAKTLLLLASTPWPETVLFPWKTLDSTVEYLGLMRFPLLNNAARILKEFSKIKVS